MNLTQLPAKLEEGVSSVLVDIAPEMKNSFSNILKDSFCLTMEMLGKLNYTQLERMGNQTEKTWLQYFPRMLTGHPLTGMPYSRCFLHPIIYLS